MTQLAPQHPPGRWGRRRDWLLGFAVLALLVTAVELSIGWSTLLAPWREVAPLHLAGVLTFTALSYVLRAGRLRTILQPFGIRHFPLLLRLTIFHNVANNLLPMRSGELVFPWLLQRYFGSNLLTAITTLIWLRLFDLHCLVLIALAIVNLREPTLVGGMSAAVWLASLGLIPQLQRLHTAHRLRGDGRLRRVLRQAVQTAPQHWWLIARLYGWTLFIWSFKFAAFVSLLHFFLPLAYWQLWFAVLGAELSSVLPVHGIAGSGSYELAMVAALTPLGIAPQLALAGAVNLHLFLLGSTVLLGALGLLIPVNNRTERHAN
ncbi:hypothetical protein CKO12_04590 [Chromatium okenii]|uniref:lysylphosphatidylglycerol synthase transmembrane domain-containing protein n=1 Tax=Chromatium okenii TaxID=61644 RepID=UPI001904E276|nr:lysylphosphatidylglycerol synthase transmembrane domain-containing protein [Chromatium okenii]MBK1641162.1 hypothetical protein [Chromatium okenii]